MSKASLSDRILSIMNIGETRSISSLAKSLRVRKADIEDAVYGVPGLDILVGIRSGGGWADLPKSEQAVERYE